MKKRPIPDVLTADEQAQLLAAMPTHTLIQRRNFCMIRCLVGLGLRSAECCDLRRQDIDWKSGQVRVTGKGGKMRILWLSDADLALLQSYVNESPSSTGLVFETGNGKPVITRFLRTLVHRLGLTAGVPRVHAHLFRHSWACRMLRKTNNLFLVSRGLGHANISSTEIYLHLHQPELRDAMRNLDIHSPSCDTEIVESQPGGPP
jgi:site-specific recombinase XerD